MRRFIFRFWRHGIDFRSGVSTRAKRCRYRTAHMLCQHDQCRQHQMPVLTNHGTTADSSTSRLADMFLMSIAYDAASLRRARCDEERAWALHARDDAMCCFKILMIFCAPRSHFFSLSGNMENL